MIIIHFNRSFAADRWEVFAARYTRTGRVPFRITIEELPELSNGERTGPSYSIRPDQAPAIVKALLDGLAEAGLMPPMGAVEAELKAVKRHLADMRSLAFESLPPQPEARS